MDARAPLAMAVLVTLASAAVAVPVAAGAAGSPADSQETPGGGPTFTVATDQISLGDDGQICVERVDGDTNRVTVANASLSGVTIYHQGARDQRITIPRSTHQGKLVMLTNRANPEVDALAAVGGCVSLDQSDVVLQAYHLRSNVLDARNVSIVTGESVADGAPAPGGFDAGDALANATTQSGAVPSNLPASQVPAVGPGQLPDDAPASPPGEVPPGDVVPTPDQLEGAVDRTGGAATNAVNEVENTTGIEAPGDGGPVEDVTNRTETPTSTVGNATGTVTNATDSTTAAVGDTTNSTTDAVDDTADSTGGTVDETTAGATDSTTDTVENTTNSTTETVDDTTDFTTDAVENTADSTTETVANTTDSTTDTVDVSTDATPTETITTETTDSTTEAVDDTTNSTLNATTETTETDSGGDGGLLSLSAPWSVLF